MRSVQELLHFLCRECDPLGLSSLCRACEAAQPRRRIRFEKPFFNGVVEQTADDTQCIAFGVSRKLLSDQVVDQNLDIITLISFSRFFPNLGRRYWASTPS